MTEENHLTKSDIDRLSLSLTSVNDNLKQIGLTLLSGMILVILLLAVVLWRVW